MYCAVLFVEALIIMLTKKQLSSLSIQLYGIQGLSKTIKLSKTVDSNGTWIT